MKTYYLGDCTTRVLMKDTDIENIYKRAVFIIIENIIEDDPEEIADILLTFRKRVKDFLENKTTYASCLDICEIYCED